MKDRANLEVLPVDLLRARFYVREILRGALPRSAQEQQNHQPHRVSNFHGRARASMKFLKVAPL
jgi:hypothetical protein